MTALCRGMGRWAKTEEEEEAMIDGSCGGKGCSEIRGGAWTTTEISGGAWTIIERGKKCL